MVIPVNIVTGQPTVIVRQCWLRGGVVPALYNATDILTAAVIPSRQTLPVFAPTPAWYTADATQSGYAQGQVQATLTIAQMLLLQPSVRYTLSWWRALSGNPSDPEMIARVLLYIEPLAIP